MVVVERHCQQCGAVCLAGAATCAACGASLKVTVPLAEEDETGGPALRLTRHLHARQLFHERYQIVRQVGVGGFGAVYEAEDIQGQRRVAIKEIGLAGLDPQQVIEATGSFNREVQMLSSLHHPGIPGMYEQLTDADHWYLVMEFIAGETLEEILERTDDGCLPLEEALRIATQVCDILSYLHHQQPAVIFRDVKPANIMLTPEGKLYLIDFGVARVYKPDKLRDTIAFGSPGYAAPEQYGRAQTTPRADIYSLGALLHQMLTGADPSLDPFHFRSLRASDASLPRALERLVTHMLAEDREQRPASSDEVGKQLKAIAALPVVLQRSKATLPQPVPPPARTALPMFSTIGVPVFIYREHNSSVGVLAWSPDGSMIASCDSDWYLHIWNAFHPSSPTVANPSLSQAFDLAWSPDGHILALADVEHVVRLWHLNQHPGWWRMAVLSLGYLSQTYEGHISDVTSLCWSPDGQMIVSAEIKGAIHVWNVRRRETLLVYQGHDAAIEDLAWSPDGTRIASASAGLVRIWRATDGDGRWRWHPKGHIQVYTLAWSPESRYLACGCSDHKVHVWDISRNHKTVVYRGHRGAVKALSWSPDGQRIASASADSTVHVWSALTGSDAFIYRGHEGSVTAVAWSPDGQHLASASEDGAVHIWKTS